LLFVQVIYALSLTGILRVAKLPPQCTFWRFLAQSGIVPGGMSVLGMSQKLRYEQGCSSSQTPFSRRSRFARRPTTALEQRPDGRRRSLLKLLKRSM
jgi:hypothetical protein